MSIILSKVYLLLIIACLTFSNSSWARVLPEEGGDGFEDLCASADPSSPMNAADCQKLIDETSTAYTATNYTLPSSTPATSPKSNEVIVGKVTDSASSEVTGKSRRAVTQANSTLMTTSTASSASTSSSTTITSSPATSKATEVSNVTFALAADHAQTEPSTRVTLPDRERQSAAWPSDWPTDDDDSTLGSTKVVVSTTSAPSKSTSKSGSLAVALNGSLLVVLLALATLLQ